MFKYFTSTKQKKYLEVLPKLVSAYNRAYHTAIKMAPVEVNDDNADQVFFNLFGHKDRLEMFFDSIDFRKRKEKIRVGDSVLRPIPFKAFSRGFLPNWKNARYTVVRRYGRKYPMFDVKDHNNNLVRERLYRRELQLVPQNDH